MSRRAGRIAGTLLGAGLALTLTGGGVVHAAHPPQADATVTVKMKSPNGVHQFAPKTVSVARGTVIKWQNVSATPHTTTSNTGLWSKKVNPGTSYQRTFSRKGTFRYHCNFHPGMTGTIYIT